MNSNKEGKNPDVTRISLMPISSLAGENSANFLNKTDQFEEVKTEYDLSQYMGVNQVLVYKYKDKTPTYYVPVYLRMRINRVN